MANAGKLSAEQITASLQGLPGWSVWDGQRIEKKFERKNFVDSVGFIQSIVPIAEGNDHHPDILLSDYKNVTVMLSTHSSGGVTMKDIELAREIDKLP